MIAMGSKAYFTRVLSLLGALGAAAGCTVLNLYLIDANAATAAMMYLLVVLVISTRARLTDAIVTSLACMLCYTYFYIPPIHVLAVTGQQNWAAVLAFLTTAITASHLSSSARERAEEAGERRREMERLYEFSRALLLGDSSRSLASQIAQKVVEVFEASEAAFYERAADCIYRAGAVEGALPEELLRTAAAEAHWPGNAAIVPASLQGRTIGNLGIANSGLSAPAVQAIAQLAAIALEREHTQELAARAEAARQNEQLKATLLDAIAHEFKTPLTSIKAALTAVLDSDDHGPSERELLTVADEEADRMNNLMSEAIELARISPGRATLERRPVGVGEIVAAAMARLRDRAEIARVETRVPAGLPPVLADHERIELVIRQLLANALKYAPQAARIRIAAEQSPDGVILRVANDGPGIPADEHDAIFEKFYRARVVRGRIPGTGMGLAIARDIIEAHGGRIWVENIPGAVCFSFRLPLA